MNKSSFEKYLATGEYTQDYEPLDFGQTNKEGLWPDGWGGWTTRSPLEREKTHIPTDLELHDAKYHRYGYKEGDSCKYRERLANGDKADDLNPKFVPEEQLPEFDPLDYNDLKEIFKIVNSAARGLNKNVGDKDALQADKRWKNVSQVANSAPAIKQVIAQYKPIYGEGMEKLLEELESGIDGIVASAKSGWKKRTSEVPSEMDFLEEMESDDTQDALYNLQKVEGDEDDDDEMLPSERRRRLDNAREALEKIFFETDKRLHREDAIALLEELLSRVRYGL